uniref:Condensin complex subunit 1 n=1 Tax=Heterorhabditis bacteriophora TaxID=37862 RepID=A0A1I7WLK1_HETBA
MAGALVEKTIHFDYMKEATMLHYPFIDAINIVAVKNDMDTLLSHMIHYVGGLGPLDFSGKSSPRPYALFIQAMAEKAPHVLVNHLTSIVMYLDNDPYILRSAVLTAFCDLVCSTVLTEESCRNSSRLMKARDKMLDKLQDHLTDSNAQVRAKVLHLWTKLAQLPRFILCRRLSDKSVMARKAAVQFMATFLVQNPYGHDFSFNLNRDQLLSKLERRDKLMKCNPENRVVATAFQKFSEVETVIRETAKKWIEKYKEGPVENDMEDTETSLVIAAIVGQLLYDTIKAVRVFVQLAFVGKLPNVNATDPTNVVVNNLVDSLRDLYVRDRIASHIQNDEECLEIEENQKDYDLAMQKINADIDWLKVKFQNKLIVELEMEQCVPHALRGVIQGELSEMKEGIKFVVECKNFMISFFKIQYLGELMLQSGKMFLSKNPADKDGLRSRLRSFQKLVREGNPQIAYEALCAIANLASGHASSNVENICESVLRIPARDSLFTTIDRFVLNG